MNDLFKFRGQHYQYFDHPFNQTRQNTRAVEVPIVWEEASGVPPKRVLELGRVLPHYFNVAHTVIDKCEPGAINVDIVDWKSPRRYSLIVSISTLEHIGDRRGKFGEQYDPEKHRRAMAVLRSVLEPEGRLIVTVPIGYNTHLDADLQAGALGFSEMYCLRRVSELEWQECAPDFSIEYGRPFRKANGVLICYAIG